MTSTITLSELQTKPLSKAASPVTSSPKISSLSLAFESAEVIALTILSPLGLLLIFVLSFFPEVTNFEHKIGATWNH